MDAPLEEGRFPAAIRPVDVGKADIVGAAVVGGEDHQGVVVQALVLQRLQHPTDVAVQVADHGAVDAQAMILDLRQGVVVGLGRLQRRVDGVVGQVHEERPVPVGVDRLDRFVRQVVGHVGRRVEHLRTVVLHGERQSAPQELVDRIPILPRFLDRRVADRREQRGAGHEAQALVEALVLGPRALDPAQVPLAQVNGVIAAGLQGLGDGDLGGGHGLGVVVLRRVLHLVLVEVRGVQRVARVTADDAREGHGRRRELKAEAGGVAAGHDRRARRGAGGVAAVAVGEGDPLVGDRVDGRGRHGPVRDTAAVQGDVVVAKVVGQDEHHVRRPLPALSHARRRDRASRPGHRVIGLDLRLLGARDHDDQVEAEMPGRHAGRDQHHDDPREQLPGLHARLPLIRSPEHILTFIVPLDVMHPTVGRLSPCLCAPTSCEA